MIDSFFNYAVSNGPGAIAGFSVGAFVSTAISVAVGINKQRKINEAIINKDIGMQYANLTYTSYR